MDTSFFYFQSEDGKQIFTRKWVADEAPRAILQIAHGMAEHIGRYEEFAQFLVRNGIYVYGNDHRGHGNTEVNREDRGYYADENGYETVVADMKQLTEIIKQDYPSVPVFMLGHSMGSFLARRYIQLYGDQLTGTILTGTGGHPGLLGRIGHFLAAREARKLGRRSPSPRMNSLTFASYNKAFKPARTDFDWLSRDEREVDRYVEDPLCGGVFTAGFFEDFLKGLLSLYDEDARIPKDLSVYFLSGDLDPVGKNSKGVLESFHKLHDAGLRDVTYKFYPGARHEVLNEKNKTEVYQDILGWIEKRL